MQSGPFSFPPLVLPAFVAGLLISAGCITWILAIKRRGRLCPECSSTTLPLVPEFPLKLFMGAAVLRWCPGCGWKGIALRPPHERRSLGGKIRLGGGFRWGFRPPPKSGFLFKEREDRTRGESGEVPVEPPRSVSEEEGDTGESHPPLSFRWRR